MNRDIPAPGADEQTAPLANFGHRSGFHVGDLVTADGASAIVGKILSFDSEGFALVRWRETETTEDPGDLTYHGHEGDDRPTAAERIRALRAAANRGEKGSTLASLFAEGQRIYDLDTDDFRELAELVNEESERRALLSIAVENAARRKQEKIARGIVNAGKALTAYQATGNQDPDEQAAVGDLIADLCHLADHLGFGDQWGPGFDSNDPERERPGDYHLRVAPTHYHAERDGDGSDL